METIDSICTFAGEQFGVSADSWSTRKYAVPFLTGVRCGGGNSVSPFGGDSNEIVFLSSHILFFKLIRFSVFKS